MGEQARAEVAVVGNGPWGGVLADLLAANHAQVLLWGEEEDAAESIARERRHPRLPDVELSPHVVVARELHEVAQAGAIILALHPDRLVPVLESLGDHLRGDHRVVCAGRGLEPATGARMTEVVRRETCVKLVGALAGPQLTLEMARGAPGGGVVASRYPGVAREMQARLSSRRYRVYTATDLPGVEYGPVLATIIAFVVGVVEGLGLGPGGQALVISRGLVEISRLGVALGAHAETFSGMSSLGVLLSSCLARTRAEYRLGVALGEDPRDVAALAAAHPEQSVLVNATMALRLAAPLKVQTPLIQAAAALLSGKLTPEQLRERLMTRPVTDEM